MTNIDLDQLATVVGGASKTQEPAKPKKLSAHRVGNTKIINDQSREDMFWEVKPF